MMQKYLLKWQFIHRWFLILLTFGVAIALYGCNPTEFKTQAVQVPQLIARTPGDPKTYNAALVQEAPNLSPFINAGLIYENKTGEIEPALAESWEISEDKLRIIFTLKQGLKWSDSQPLTVDDVVFSYNDIYLNPKLPTPAQDSFKIGEKGLLPKVRKLDDRRLEFITPEPFAPFLRITGAAIFPKHVLGGLITSKDSKAQPKFL
ncbi:MAG TPA: peptide ABC transporter substrate-binding protein, partial [Cyanobacteria bacterium UBA11049]|nr:peptide ABC transporter substrate-binding protein [Cyanobacteria bacterium UBA11049]